MLHELLRRNGFSLDRLATLSRVARFGTITAASKDGARGDGEVASRQTQYGRQIRELGEAFGRELLDTSRKPYRLTSDGIELARLTAHFLAGLEDYLAQGDEAQRKLMVGAGESLIQWYLIPRMMPRLREGLPDTPVLFKNLRTQSIVEGLEDGELDLGLLRENAVVPPLKRGPRISYDYFYYVPRAFRAGFSGSVDFRDMARYPMAVLEGGGEFRTQLEQGFREAEVTPDFRLECSSSTQMALAVQRREYAAVLPEIAREQLPDHVLHYPIRGVELRRTLCLAWHPARAEQRSLLRRAIAVFKK